jgi:uncharacterized protein YxjI
VTTQSNTPAGWYPDPHGAARTLRYWDGARWTDHTHADQQAQAVPAQPPAAPHVPAQPAAPDPRVQHQVQQQAGVAAGGPGGGSLFSEPVLVVNQKAKLIELTNEYTVMDQHGNQLGSVVQVGQSALRKVVRFLASIDQYLTHKLEIRDAHGRPVLRLTRPAKFLKSRVIVERPDGQPVGEIVQQNVFGKINFAMTANGSRSARSRRRTGGPGTSRSSTTRTTRSPGSPRPGKASPRRCSRPRTTTSCRSTTSCPSRC